MTDLTRRTMLNLAAAAGAVGTATLGPPVTAEAAAPGPADDSADRALFFTLSAALTGIDEAKLAPAVDPVQVGQEYFDQAKGDPGFSGLLQIIRANPKDPLGAADQVMNNADPKIKYLGRSIILAWYLGVWYAPTTLQSYNGAKPGPFPVVPVKVISPKAYTQGWTWRVAQAHPMGYSDLRFGYWAEDPLPLTDITQVQA